MSNSEPKLYKRRKRSFFIKDEKESKECQKYYYSKGYDWYTNDKKSGIYKDPSQCRRVFPCIMGLMDEAQDEFDLDVVRENIIVWDNIPAHPMSTSYVNITEWSKFSRILKINKIL